ncbi:hypothetical protein NMY22_g11013 [Coprinellus aureogranulatus]|nr:hypothetical protein NMY22_g11013 [Coprinellus aureogranulatus]
MLSPEDPKAAKRLSTDSATATPRASLSSVAQTITARTPSPTRFLGPKQPTTDSPRPSAESSSRPTSPSSLNPNAAPIRPAISRSKSPKPPKPTPAEAEYLRRILADVSTPGPAEPFIHSIQRPSASSPSSEPRNKPSVT